MSGELDEERVYRLAELESLSTEELQDLLKQAVAEI